MEGVLFAGGGNSCWHLVDSGMQGKFRAAAKRAWTACLCFLVAAVEGLARRVERHAPPFPPMTLFVGSVFV